MGFLPESQFFLQLYKNTPFRQPQIFALQTVNSLYVNAKIWYPTTLDKKY